MATVVVTVDQVQVVGSDFVDKPHRRPDGNGSEGAEDLLKLVIAFILNLKISTC